MASALSLSRNTKNKTLIYFISGIIFMVIEELPKRGFFWSELGV
jgi:hypothetical protein